MNNVKVLFSFICMLPICPLSCAAPMGVQNHYIGQLYEKEVFSDITSAYNLCTESFYQIILFLFSNVIVMIIAMLSKRKSQN